MVVGGVVPLPLLPPPIIMEVGVEMKGWVLLEVGTSGGSSIGGGRAGGCWE